MVDRKKRSKKTTRSSRLKVLGIIFAVVCAYVIASLSLNFVRALSAADSKHDAYVVSSGTIRVAMDAAKISANDREVPFLVCSYVPEPCAWLIFRRANAPMKKVWLLKGEHHTLNPLFDSVSILRKWGAKKVTVIVSSTHEPRVSWGSEIIYLSSGIYPEILIVEEPGVPFDSGELKTTVDLTRSIFFAIVNQFGYPHFSKLVQLTSVDMDDWMDKGFRCEHQAGLNDPRVRERLIRLNTQTLDQ